MRAAFAGAPDVGLPGRQLEYFPRWAGCVAPGNLPMGMWRDISTHWGARRSRGSICRTSLWVACGAERVDASLQGAHDADLGTDHLPHHRLAEPTGRYRGVAQAVPQFGTGTTAAICG